MRQNRLVIGIAGAGLVLGACGGDDDSTSDGADGATPAGTVLEVTALDSLKFDPSSLTAAAGTIEIRQSNDGSLQHSLVIDGVDGFRLLNDESGTVELEAGTYVFFCDVPGHRDGGMEGTLTVR